MIMNPSRCARSSSAAARVVLEGMNPPDQLPLLHRIAKLHERLPDAILRTGSVVLQVARIHQNRRVLSRAESMRTISPASMP